MREWISRLIHGLGILLIALFILHFIFAAMPSPIPFVDYETDLPVGTYGQTEVSSCRYYAHLYTTDMKVVKNYYLMLDENDEVIGIFCCYITDDFVGNMQSGTVHFPVKVHGMITAIPDSESIAVAIGEPATKPAESGETQTGNAESETALDVSKDPYLSMAILDATVSETTTDSLPQRIVDLAFIGCLILIAILLVINRLLGREKHAF